MDTTFSCFIQVYGYTSERLQNWVYDEQEDKTDLGERVL